MSTEQKKEQYQNSFSKNQPNILKENNFIHNLYSGSNSFFQVNINAQKLAQMFNRIDQYFFDHDKKLERMAKNIQSTISSFETKFQSQSRKNGILFTKMDMRISQNNNVCHCLVSDIHKKSQQRDTELSNRIQLLKSKIGKVEDCGKQDLASGLLKLKKQIIGDSLIQNKQIDRQLKDQVKKMDFNYLITYFTECLQKLKDSILPSFNQLYNIRQLEKKKQHAEDMYNLACKKQQIQSQSFKDDINNQYGNMRVVYSKIKNEFGRRQNQIMSNQAQGKGFSNRIRHMSYTKMSGIEQQIVQGYRQMIPKIQHMEQALAQHAQLLIDLKNKVLVIDQKTQIVTRKIEKNSQQTAEIKNNIRRVQNQKMDDKTLDQLKNYLKWTVRDFQQKITKKCSQQDLQKQKTRVTQKLSIIHENLTQKADKGQIQKALLFLENKIKQIIFLIAAEQSQQREGAIMKMAAKCLSCDKQVERHIQMQSNCKRDLNKQSQGQYIKSMTHRVRQRYKKQMAKTLGNQTLDD